MHIKTPKQGKRQTKCRAGRRYRHGVYYPKIYIPLVYLDILKNVREKADYITVSFKITSDKSLEAGERTRIDNISREKESTEKQEVLIGTAVPSSLLRR